MTATSIRYLNTEMMNNFDNQDFQGKHPFPWCNPQGFFNPEHYQELLDNMPPLESFRPSFGKQRKSGQSPHDRYILDYEEGVELPEPWAQVMEELLSDTYRKFVCRLLGVKRVRFRFHFHYF